MSDDVLEKLRREYEETIPGKMKELRELIDALKKRVDVETLKTLRMKVHKIAGSAGTYGFTTVSNICRKFEAVILDKLGKLDDLKSDWTSEFEQYFRQIEEGFANGE